MGNPAARLSDPAPALQLASPQDDDSLASMPPARPVDIGDIPSSPVMGGESQPVGTEMKRAPKAPFSYR